MNVDRRVCVLEEVFQKYVGYEAIIVFASGLTNDIPASWTEEVLREVEVCQRDRFINQKPSEDPLLAEWRCAYAAFGSKPNKYYCSPEAMLRRVLKGQQLPSINPIVNLYNAVSLKHLVPIGGEDLSAVVGIPTLKLARGDELFTTSGTNGRVEHPNVGEVVWADELGVNCRRWNWRQCERTMITTSTHHAYFVLDRLAGTPTTVISDATNELVEGLKRFGPNVDIRTECVSEAGVEPIYD